MIAYTAWDSLQTIAQQFDADLALAPDDRLELAPHRERSARSAPLRRFAELLRRGFTARYARSGSRA